MKKFAYIVGTNVHSIFEDIVPLNLKDSVVDITNMDIIPKIGMLYDKTSHIFSTPHEETSQGKKEIKIIALRQVTTQKIFQLLSDTQQRNALYTLYKHNKKAKSALTVDEKAEIQDLESKWDKIESIRAVSNIIEAEINNLQTIEEIQDYDIQNNPLWPTT